MNKMIKKKKKKLNDVDDGRRPTRQEPSQTVQPTLATIRPVHTTKHTKT